MMWSNENHRFRVFLGASACGLLLTLAASSCSQGEDEGEAADNGETAGGGSSQSDEGSNSEGTTGQIGGAPGQVASDRFSVGFGQGGAAPGWLVEPPDDLDFDYDPSLDAEPDECVALQLEPEAVQLDMFLVLDRSGSMDAPFVDDSGEGDCNLAEPNNGSRWCNAINAIHGFASDPSSVGMGLAYADFAFSPCGGFDMTVPLAELMAEDENGQLGALRAALNAAKPGFGTNTEGAVRTLIGRTESHRPLGNRRTVGILVTDGQPYLRPEPVALAWQNQACEVEATGVDAHLTELNALLVTHFSQTKIPTFIIGMEGAEEIYLELLAAGAGAVEHAEGCVDGDADCHYYSVGAGDPAVFQAALEEIRRSVLGCEYAIPTSSVGLIDLGNLAVAFSVDTGEPLEPLTRVAAEASCTGGDEFFLDQTEAEPVVHICPNLCAARGEGASVDISISCQGS